MEELRQYFSIGKTGQQAIPLSAEEAYNSDLCVVLNISSSFFPFAPTDNPST
jgi:hypothetical protein